MVAATDVGRRALGPRVGPTAAKSALGTKDYQRFNGAIAGAAGNFLPFLASNSQSSVTARTFSPPAICAEASARTKFSRPPTPG